MKPDNAMRRPYAPPSNVISVLQRLKTRNPPDVIDPDFLSLAGISGLLQGRTMEALRFLGLTGEDGRPTDLLDSLAASSDDEYREILSGVVRHAYAEDFERADPANESQAQIVSAFRRYFPRSQTARMVMLFLGLCREAGIPVSEATRERTMRPSSAKAKPKALKQPAGGKRDELPPGGHDYNQDGRGILFGVTEADIAVLGEDEFQEVWAALGTVARARARRANAPRVPEAEEVGTESRVQTDDQPTP